MDAEATVKSCCADLYASQWATVLLGDSLHPGGAALTNHLGQLMRLRPGMRVLDVAAGRGDSAVRLSREFGCQVVGVDYGVANATAAARAAAAQATRATFIAGDAELLPCASARFDAVVCECAFCTFPDKAAAAAEVARVLQPGGVAGFADLVRRGSLPPGLDDLVAWLACIAGASSPQEYVAQLTAAGLDVVAREDHDHALAELVRTVRLRLMGAEIAAHVAGAKLPFADLARARDLATAAARAVAEGSLGYVVIVARKPA